MAVPSFLFRDPSWRTVVIPWDREYNNRLSDASQNPLPVPVTSIELPDLRDLEITNNNALGQLDSRQITPEGLLPIHLCGYAFHTWSKGEQRIMSRMERIADYGYDSDELVVEQLTLAGWLMLIRFNLANLTLIDETSPQFMRSMAHEQISEILEQLESMASQEGELEQALGGSPCSTRQVRHAIEYAVRGRTLSPLERLFGQN